MIPVLITNYFLTVFYFPIYSAWKLLLVADQDLTIFLQIFPIALPFFGAGLVHMISKPNPGRTPMVVKAAVGGKGKDLTIDFGNIDDF